MVVEFKVMVTLIQSTLLTNITNQFLCCFDLLVVEAPLKGEERASRACFLLGDGLDVGCLVFITNVNVL